MKKLPKHLIGMAPEELERLQKGFNRFRFGFAEVGEIFPVDTKNSLVFLGNFNRKKDADALEADDVKINPYLYGKLVRGWAVWRRLN